MSRGYDPDRLRTGLCTVRLERVFRVIHRSHGAAPLAAVPSPSRFSDPQGGYSVLYGAETVRCAFWETLGRNRFARRREGSSLATELSSPCALTWAICVTGPSLNEGFGNVAGRIASDLEEKILKAMG